MTQTPVRGLAIDNASQDAVIDYLQRHPDFFERHPQLLARLRIPHERNTSTVSLVERQVQVLRDKNQNLDGKLREFVDVARSNDQLIDKIHGLSCRLIAARGALQIVDALEISLREDFGACEWLMVLTRTGLPEIDRLQHRHLRSAQRGDVELRAFETFFESARPRCGQIRDSQRDYLFGAGTIEIGSAALVPLGPDASYGVLAIGSNDASRFTADMSTDYLARIGELVSAAVGEL
ncbi:MAG: DUF484 family protein [Candidatus Obscuribacterales bacterium]|nr:DUF484 family protein [Steroidobacteraceae bacterium]